MTENEKTELLIRLDERSETLVKSMDNHLRHHEIFESNLEKRLDELASRNILTPFINLIKYFWK